MKLLQYRRPTLVALTSTLALGLFACALVTPVTHAADAYSFTRITIPGAIDVFGQGINNKGETAGNYGDANNPVIGWIRTKSGLTTYNFGVAGSTEVNGLNETGLAWGTYLGHDDIGHGFTLEHGVKSDLDVPGAIATIPIGINNSGFVSGVVVDANGNVRGFTGSRGAFTPFDYPAPGVEVTLLFGNNELGQVVGVYFDAQGGHSFLKTGSKLTPVNVPGSQYTQAASINNRGEIGGHYQTTPNLPAHVPEHGFVLRNGVYTTVNYPGAVATRLFEINDSGDIIGSAVDSNGHSFGFIATLGKNSSN